MDKVDAFLMTIQVEASSGISQIEAFLKKTFTRDAVSVKELLDHPPASAVRDFWHNPLMFLSIHPVSGDVLAWEKADREAHGQPLDLYINTLYTLTTVDKASYDLQAASYGLYMQSQGPASAFLGKALYLPQTEPFAPSTTFDAHGNCTRLSIDPASIRVIDLDNQKDHVLLNPFFTGCALLWRVVGSTAYFAHVLPCEAIPQGAKLLAAIKTPGVLDFPTPAPGPHDNVVTSVIGYDDYAGATPASLPQDYKKTQIVIVHDQYQEDASMPNSGWSIIVQSIKAAKTPSGDPVNASAIISARRAPVIPYTNSTSIIH